MRSFARYFPPGFKSAIYGVSLKIFATSIISKSIPISLANAGRCNAAFVEPPEHATILAALIRDFLLQYL